MQLNENKNKWINRTNAYKIDIGKSSSDQRSTDKTLKNVDAN